MADARVQVTLTTERQTVQEFVRLTPTKSAVLTTIGQEWIDTGQVDAADLDNHRGGINTSEVIRRLLAKADSRLA